MSTAVTPVLGNDQWRLDLAKSIDTDMRNENRDEKHRWLKTAKRCKAFREMQLFELVGFKSYSAWLNSLRLRSYANEAINLYELFSHIPEGDLLEISRENLKVLAERSADVRADWAVLAKARVLSTDELRKHLGLEPDSTRLSITVPSAATEAVKFALEVAAVMGEPGLHPLHKIALRFLQSPCEILVTKLQTDGGHARKLAEEYLRQRGISPEPVEVLQ